MNAPLRLGFLGAGHVGGATLRYLREHADHFTAMAGRPVEITRLVVRDRDKAIARLGDWIADRLATDIESVIGAYDVDVVVATMGGIDPEEGCIRRALAAEQHVVTANKAIIARSGPVLERLARNHKRALLYEAAVGGGTPILRSLASSLGPVELCGIEGVLNGTCNFLLSRLRAGEAWDDALAEAQRLGLAEADPSMDVDGIDAAQKLQIAVGLGAGAWLAPGDMAQCGIRGVRASDFAAAAAMGATVVLVAQARHRDDGTWEAGVEPCFVTDEHPLAHLSAEENAVRLATTWGGPFTLAARGAGGEPTSVAVLGDLLAIARDAWQGEKRRSLAEAAPVVTRAIGSATTRCYVRRSSAPADTSAWESLPTAIDGTTYQRSKAALTRAQAMALAGPGDVTLYPVLRAS